MKAICFLFCCFISANLYSQGLNNVLNVLKAKKVGKAFTHKEEMNISYATYLGAVNNKGKRLFYVVKEFYKVKAAIVYHGHSRILFFDNHQKLLAEAVLDMPYELPYKLYKNTLYFKKLKENNFNPGNILIKNSLPKDIHGFLVNFIKE